MTTDLIVGKCMKKYRGLIIFLIFVSCSSPTDKLFWIDSDTNHKNDFLNMVESTNVNPISSDSIKYFLTKSEIKEISKLDSIYNFDKSTQSKAPIFKNFGKLHQSSKFQLHVLLRDDRKVKKRDYQFILRTYDNNFKIIDSFILADWDEENEHYCFGEINKSLTITKQCDKNNKIQRFHISKSGTFEEVLND